MHNNKSLDVIMQSAKVSVLPGVSSWLPLDAASQPLEAMWTAQWGDTRSPVDNLRARMCWKYGKHCTKCALWDRHIRLFERPYLSGARKKPPCFLMGSSARRWEKKKYILFRKSAGPVNTSRSINAWVFSFSRADPVEVCLHKLL